MKIKLSLFLSFFLIFYSMFPLHTYASMAEDIISDTALLMDAETGQVLFDKGGSTRMYPASTTKIMTAWLAAEKADMSELATVSKTAVDIDEWDSANIALAAGEELPLDSLMYGLMLPSANDAANVIAEHIAGSQEAFAQLMTERAQEIGAVNTRFANAHGLHHPEHYTTAYDLALITRAAVRDPLFMKYFGAGTHTIPPTNLQPSERPFTNYQYMLVSTSRFYNPDVIGGKVGYTHEAMHTMSTVAEKDGRTLICVVMHSQNREEKFADTEWLLNLGFDEFTEITVPGQDFSGLTAKILDGEIEAGEVTFRSRRDFQALLHNSASMASLQIGYTHKSPFKKGEDIASSAEFTVRTEDPSIPRLLGRLSLEPEISMYKQENTAAALWEDSLSAIREHPWSIPLMMTGVAAIAYLAIFITRQISLRRRRERRRQRLLKIQMQREAMEREMYRGPVPRVTPREKMPR